MAKQKKSSAAKQPAAATTRRFTYCTMPQVKEREFGPEVNPNRVRLIRMNDKKWLNGTRLHYYFFTAPANWTTREVEKNVVRKAFKLWKDVGVGLEFEEVDSVDEAEIRIGFLRGDGAIQLQELLDVMDRLKDAGIEQVGIVARLPEER